VARKVRIKLDWERDNFSEIYRSLIKANQESSSPVIFFNLEWKLWITLKKVCSFFNHKKKIWRVWLSKKRLLYILIPVASGCVTCIIRLINDRGEECAGRPQNDPFSQYRCDQQIPLNYTLIRNDKFFVLDQYIKEAKFRENVSYLHIYIYYILVYCIFLATWSKVANIGGTATCCTGGTTNQMGRTH
jgi:hypothetical protein